MVGSLSRVWQLESRGCVLSYSWYPGIAELSFEFGSRKIPHLDMLEWLSAVWESLALQVFVGQPWAQGAL